MAEEFSQTECLGSGELRADSSGKTAFKVLRQAYFRDEEIRDYLASRGSEDLSKAVETFLDGTLFQTAFELTWEAEKGKYKDKNPLLLPLREAVGQTLTKLDILLKRQKEETLRESKVSQWKAIEGTSLSMLVELIREIKPQELPGMIEVVNVLGIYKNKVMPVIPERVKDTSPNNAL